MRALIINLSAETERMAFQRAQMAMLGLDWERLEATTSDTLPVPLDDPHWQRWERPLRAVEAAVLVSHVRAWERIEARGEPHLVLEDDALLAAEAPAFLRAVESPGQGRAHGSGGGSGGRDGGTDGRAERFDHVGLETVGRKKLVGPLHPRLPIRRLYQDRAGAGAYALWPAGARKLLARAAVRPGPVDAVISSTYELDSWHTDPALSLQLFLFVEHGMTPPIATQSSVHTKTQPRGHGIYRLRRIASQLRMGLRYLSKVAVAERRDIPLSSDWPALDLPADFGARPDRRTGTGAPDHERPTSNSS